MGGRSLARFKWDDPVDFERNPAVAAHTHAPVDLPISMTKLVAGSHSSEGLLPNKHLIVLAEKSDGVLDATVGNVSDVCKTSDNVLTFAPLGALQRYDFSGETRNLMLTIDDAFMRRLAAQWEAEVNVNLLDPLVLFRNSRLQFLIKELDRTLVDGDLSWRIQSEAYALQIGAELLSHFTPTSPVGGKAQLDRRDLDQVEAYVAEHLDANIGLTEIAAVLDMDIFSFGRAFKAATGVSPGRYVLRQRIEQACGHLRGTDWPLAEIAYRCGFSSQAHMTTTFKKHLGVTPGKFRASR